MRNHALLNPRSPNPFYFNSPNPFRSASLFPPDFLTGSCTPTLPLHTQYLIQIDRWASNKTQTHDRCATYSLVHGQKSLPEIISDCSAIAEPVMLSGSCPWAHTYYAPINRTPSHPPLGTTMNSDGLYCEHSNANFPPPPPPCASVCKAFERLLLTRLCFTSLRRVCCGV